MTRIPEVTAFVAGLSRMHEDIAERGGFKKAKVRCERCGFTQEVDGAACLRQGWPKCCGYTMTLLTVGPK